MDVEGGEGMGFFLRGKGGLMGMAGVVVVVVVVVGEGEVGVWPSVEERSDGPPRPALPVVEKGRW